MLGSEHARSRGLDLRIPFEDLREELDEVKAQLQSIMERMYAVESRLADIYGIVQVLVDKVKRPWWRKKEG